MKLKLFKTKKELLEIALEYNKIIGEYTEYQLQQMDKNNLKYVIEDSDYLLEDPEIIWHLITDYLKNNLYRLEKKSIKFKWSQTIINNEQIIEQTNEETYQVNDFQLYQLINVPNKMTLTIDEYWKPTNFTKLSYPELDQLYIKICEILKDEDVYTKIMKVRGMNQ